MSPDGQVSTGRLRTVLATDLDGAWCTAFAAQLQALAESAITSMEVVTQEELRHRCQMLARGARLAAELLPGLRAQGPSGFVTARLPQANAALIARSTQTSMLLELGWLAIEAGRPSEGLFIVESVGTLLHGRLGGALFRVESLLALGRPFEAAKTLEDCLGADADPDGTAATLVAALWAQRNPSHDDVANAADGAAEQFIRQARLGFDHLLD